jgi:hypothetical protein
MSPWLFVTGVPRSGTTLAAWLLNQHPMCAVLMETMFPIHLLHAFRPPVPIKWGCADMGWGEAEQITMMKWSLPRLSLPSLTQPEPRMSQVGLARAMCRTLRNFYDVPVFGDKCPFYCFHWQELREMFPECCIVVCERDFETAYASYRRQAWACDETDEKIREYMEQAQETIAGCPDVVKVRLERLEADPETEITSLLQSLGLSISDYPMDVAVDQVLHGKLN